MVPFVSVIIPVFNDSETIYDTLNNLQDQNYQNNMYEIIVVDNGSTDNTINIVQRFDDVILLYEHDNLYSPYSARNRGIEKAKGDIIALLDATCIPGKEWLIKGVHCLQGDNAKIAGGNVVFRYGNKRTASMMYDAINNIKMKESILERKVAKTANLFILRDVFDKVGFFPEGVRSGADVRWTRKATNSGLKMNFCEEALVSKSARPFVELIKKQWRVGLAQPKIWEEENKDLSILKHFFKIFLPVRPNAIRTAIKKRGTPDMGKYILSLLLVGQVIRVVTGVANCIGIFNMRREKANK